MSGAIHSGAIDGRSPDGSSRDAGNDGDFDGNAGMAGFGRSDQRECESDAASVAKPSFIQALPDER